MPERAEIYTPPLTGDGRELVRTIPTPGGFIRASGTEARVCEDIARRQSHGLAKYGVTVAENPLGLRQWLQHQYEELLDAAVYCRRAIEELDKGADDGK